MTESGNAMIQSIKSQTLRYRLNDSPAGQTSWIVEKFRKWSDYNGDVENRFTKDDLLTNITLYRATKTINSATRIYYETAKHPVEGTAKIGVPIAGAIFWKDLISAPKEFTERFYNIRQWTDMSKGGHFAAIEQPELLDKDIREFAKAINKKQAGKIAKAI